MRSAPRKFKASRKAWTTGIVLAVGVPVLASLADGILTNIVLCEAAGAVGKVLVGAQFQAHVLCGVCSQHDQACKQWQTISKYTIIRAQPPFGPGLHHAQVNPQTSFGVSIVIIEASTRRY